MLTERRVGERLTSGDSGKRKRVTHRMTNGRTMGVLMDGKIVRKRIWLMENGRDMKG
jgi:hypothetical protein